jgi:hypothetical protein
MADVSGKFFSAKKVRTGVSPSSPGVEQGETLPPVNPPGSDLNSVGLSMPSAFEVANSPLTSNGTIAVTGAGTVAQYVRGDGSLADFPESIGSGASVSYYLNGSVNQGTIGGVTYYEMNKTPIIGAGTDFTRNSNGYIASFLTDANDPALLVIPAGNWNFETYFEASSGGGSPTFYLELYKYDGTTFSLIASNSGSPKLINDGTEIEAYFSALAVPQTTLTLTDRLAIRIYVTTAGRTLTLHTENNTLCQVITTFTTGLSALNGLTAQVQFFAVGTSGTNFNIASATDTHTFNLPTASATNRGALASADWSTFNNKQNQLNGTGFVKASGTTISYDNSTYQVTSEKGQPNGYASLDGNGKVPLAQINDALIGNVNYQGLWNAATNNPTLVNPPSSGTKGYYYIVSTAGTFASISFEVGDWIISNGSAWQKVDNTDAVSSVFGRTGNVIAANGDYNTSQVTENTNLYYTEARVSANTDVAANTAARHNAVTLGTANGLSLSTQQLSLQLATSGQNGALSSTDWTTFNNKENAITAGTTAQYFRGDKTFQTLNTSVVPELTNLYYTEARVSANTDVAANTAARHNAVTLGTANGLSLSTQQLSLGLASAGVTGALSGTDWSAFNSKQQALNGTGFVKISGTTISYDNSTYLTTAAAASTYLALAGGTMTGNVNWGQTDRGITWAFNTDAAYIKFFNTGDGDTDSRLEFATQDNNDEYFRWGHVPSGGSFYESMRLRPIGSGSAELIVTGKIIKSGGTSSQFLKADGSVDSNSYYLSSNPSAFIALTALSGTAPIQYNNTTGAISITQASGSTNGFLSSTDWNTFNNKTSNVGTVTSVAALTLGTSGTDLSSTVANSTTTPVITLNVPTASATNRGALSAADWTTFNNKQNALTNPVTGTGTANTIPKFTGTSTIGNSLLTDNGTTLAYGNNIISVGASNTSEKYLEFGSSNGAYYVGGTSSEHYIFGQGDKPLRLYTNGTLKATLTSSGNLGLGVTPSAWASDFRAMQIGLGTSLYNNSNTNGTFLGSNFFFNGSNNIYLGTGTATAYAQSLGSHVWYTAPSGTAGNAISFTQAMTLGTNSGLSIGTPSAAPSQGLLVQGAVTLNSANNQIRSGNELRFYRTDNLIYTQLYDGGGTNGFVIDNRNGDGFSFQSAGTNQLRIASTGAATFSSSVTASSIIRSGGTSSQYLMADGSVSTLTNPVTGTGTAGQVAYWSSGSAITGESNLFWDATNDRLGIGRNNPSQRLDILGSGTVYANIENSDATIAAVITKNTSKTFTTGLVTDYWAVIDATSGSNTRLMIESGGNVLINTTTNVTGANLNVNGNIRTAAPTGGSAENWKLGNAVNGTVNANRLIRVEIAGVGYDLVARQII